MGQIKIYGLAKQLNQQKERMSEVIHSCVMDALQYPADKKFHRFFPMDKSDFFFPASRTENYTIIEISLFEGRSTEAKKELINLLFLRLQQHLNINHDDVEITLFETPKHNWGIRGVPGDELQLTYKVNV